MIAGKLTLIWQVDGLDQYYPAFLYIGKYLQSFVATIFQGQWLSPTFDLSIGMEEEIIGYFTI